MQDRDDAPVRQSLLTMLSNEEPDRKSDRQEGRKHQIQRLEESVRLDLQNLLNSRQRWRSWPKSLENVSESIADYGVPDLSGADLASNELRGHFLETLARTIRKFEPRLNAVRITSLEGDDPHDRTLRFRIEATLRAETGLREEAFEFELEPVSRYFH